MLQSQMYSFNLIAHDYAFARVDKDAPKLRIRIALCARNSLSMGTFLSMRTFQAKSFSCGTCVM